MTRFEKTACGLALAGGLVIGGLGTLTGSIIGAILLVVMWESMRNVSPYAHMLLFATLVIVVMNSAGPASSALSRRG